MRYSSLNSFVINDTSHFFISFFNIIINIQIFYIINIDVAKYLFLDEQFSQISEQYIDNFMEFIHELCDDTGLSIVLITHDNKFIKYGDRIYTADRGKFTLKEN